MSELTKKRVHWTEYNGDELLHDEDVDVLTSADAVTFDDGEDLQYKYTKGQFVNPSVTGSLSSLSTTNKSSLVDAINEVKTNATSNESSIGSLTDRMSTSETDIDNLENRVTPISLGGTGATTTSEALVNLGLTATASELNFVDGVTSNIQTQIDGKASSSHNHSASNITSGTLAIARGGTGASTASNAVSNLKTALVDLIYPVGSIHLSVNSANPSTYFGGTWVSWGAGRVPVGVKTSDSSFSTVEKTGGEKTHTLTVEELAKHTHQYYHQGVGAILVDVHDADSNVVHWGEETKTSGVSGDSQPHNNLQPYITCYMWKRTA